MDSGRPLLGIAFRGAFGESTAELAEIGSAPSNADFFRAHLDLGGKRGAGMAKRPPVAIRSNRHRRRSGSMQQALYRP
jgi:hypothetical protein